METIGTTASDKQMSNSRRSFDFRTKTDRNYSRLTLFFFIIFFNGLSIIKAQNSSNTKEPDRIQSNDALKRLEGGLQYADALLDSSLSLAIKAVDSIIKESENQEYALGMVRGELKKSWYLLLNVNYEASLRSAHKAKVILEKGALDSLEMTRTLNLLGLIYMEFKQFDRSRNYMNKALSWLQMLGDSTKINRVYNNLGALSKKQGKFREAIQYYKYSRELRVLEGDSNRIAYSDVYIGDTYLEIGQMDSADFYFKRGLALFNRSSNLRGIVDVVHIKFGKYYIAVGNYEKALEHLEIGLNNSLANGSTDRWIKGYDLLSEAMHRSGQKNKAFRTLKKRIALTDSLNVMTNAAAIMEIEERYQNVETEKKLMRSLAENLEKESEIMSIRIQFISSLTIAMLLIITVMLIYWYRAQKRKVSQASLQTALASTKLMALRSQMNSHFVFNSINTVQGFVSNNQKESTYNYLSKFAKLLRGILESSNSDYVTLENEIDLLKNYIDIETIRFKNKFSYDLSLEDVLENEIFEIPSMIIQPFIENAINHGLINLEKRNGYLRIKLSKNAQEILCVIEDNGVGRERALEIKKRKQRYYKSQAFSNVKERLHLLSQQGEAQVKFEVTDLFDSKNKAAGTKVEIWMPFR